MLLATPPLDVQAAVLEAVYPSIDRAIGNRLQRRIGSFGKLVAPLLLLQVRPRLGVAPADLRPADHISGLGCPVLIVGGMQDRPRSPIRSSCSRPRVSRKNSG